MKNRSLDERKKINEEIQKILNGENQETDPFGCWIEEFIHIVENMNWNELRKLATSVNISVNTKRREEIVRELNEVYMKKNRKGRPRP